jgi:hypothetical protein
MVALNITGQRHGRLVAVAFSEMRGKNAYWRFRCDCGNEAVTAAANVKQGSSASCGCLRRELKQAILTVHGHSDGSDRIYRIWHAMRSRCLNPKAANYRYYGARGITICQEWGEYLVFRAWAVGNGYDPALSIDREDNDGNYEPGNCRWATASQQQRNKRNSKRH